jgi:hypothetical protein
VVRYAFTVRLFHSLHLAGLVRSTSCPPKVNCYCTSKSKVLTHRVGATTRHPRSACTNSGRSASSILKKSSDHIHASFAGLTVSGLPVPHRARIDSHSLRHLPLGKAEFSACRPKAFRE